MEYKIYNDLKVAEDFSVIDFMSVGKKGNIPKRIVFHATEWSNVYNLAFGDIDKNGEIDDYNISDNGDRNKILATVASVVKHYTEKYPDRIISFTGSTIERTRLYRMAINLNFAELSTQFEIYSFIDDTIMPFSASQDTKGFFVKRKFY